MNRLGSIVPAGWAGPLAILGAIAFWGLVPASTRFLVDSLEPEQILLWRFASGGAFAIFIILVFRPRMPARSQRLRMVLLGLFGALGFNVPVAFGIRLIEGGIAAMLIGTQPLFIAIFAAFLLHEQISSRMKLGLGLALLGTIVIGFGGNTEVRLSSDYLFGCLLVTAGAFAYALYSVLAKPYLGERIPAPAIAMTGTLASLPIMVPFGYSGFFEGLSRLSFNGWLAALLLGLGASVLAPILFNLGLSLGEASRSGLYLNLVPVTGVVSSLMLLGERLSIVAIVGGVAILAGVVIASVGFSRQPSRIKQDLPAN